MFGFLEACNRGMVGNTMLGPEHETVLSVWCDMLLADILYNIFRSEAGHMLL